MSTVLLAETRDRICWLTLNDPASRNSLSEAMMAALEQAIAAAAADAGTRVIVISALGPVFCAGHNLKEITAHRAAEDRGRAYFERLMAQCARLMQSIVACPKPVIAKVLGTATAAGCQLVASCDLAIASDRASFATPGVNIGLFCSTPMVALSRNVGHKPAMEMLLTGEAISAEEARRIGLVNRVEPADALDEAVDALARKIAEKPPAVVKIGKEAFYRQAEMPLAQAYAYTAAVMTENLLAKEAISGIGAFLEKRRSPVEAA